MSAVRRSTVLGTGVVGVGAGVAVYVGSLVARAGQDYSPGWEVVFANTLLALCTVLIGGCAVRSPRHRRALVLLTAAAGMYAAGNIAYGIYAMTGTEVPYPSWADIGYLAFPVLAGAAVLLAARPDSGESERALITGPVALDGLMGAVAAAAVTSAVLGSVLGVDWLTDLTVLEFAVSVAYPILDTALLAIAVGVMCLPRRPSGAFVPLIAAGAALFAVADLIYTARVLTDSYVFGSPLDATWIIGVYLCVLAAWRGPGPDTYASPALARIFIPLGSFSVGLGLLIAGNLVPLLTPTVVLAATCAAIGIVEGYLGMRRVEALVDADRLSRTDDLTGLRNRRGFHHVLDVLLESVPRDGRVLVMFIDVNAFKSINDRFGHSVGDLALQHVSTALSRSIRPQDIAARLGGDEFAVVGTLTGMDRDDAVEVGRLLTERLAAALAAPVTGAPETVQVAVSTGWEVSPEDGTDAATLLRRADRRMYRDKSARR